MIFEKWIDDRPPGLPRSNEYWSSLDKMAADIIDKYPDAKEPFVNGS